MEPVGLTLGIAGLFAASLDVLDRISTAKSYRKDYPLFVTKIETERLRLQLWGQAVGLEPADGTSTAPHLHDPRVWKAVNELLTWAIQLFEDSETIKKRHAPTRALVAILPKRNRSQITPTALTASTGVRGSSTIMKMKWALSGKRSLEKLLQELSWFMDKLHELVPTPTKHRAIIISGSTENVLTSSTSVPVLPPPLATDDWIDWHGTGRRSRIRHDRLVSGIRSNDSTSPDGPGLG